MLLSARGASTCRCGMNWGASYTDDLFADLYPADGQPAIAPWRLALVTGLTQLGRIKRAWSAFATALFVWLGPTVTSALFLYPSKCPSALRSMSFLELSAYFDQKAAHSLQ